MGHYCIQYILGWNALSLALWTYRIDLKCRKKTKTKIMSMIDGQSSDVRAVEVLWPLFESQGEWGFQRNEYFIDMMWIRNPIRYYSMLWSKIAQPEEFIKLLHSYLYWTFRPSWYNRHDMQYMYWKVLSYQLEFEWRMRWILQQDESL